MAKLKSLDKLLSTTVFIAAENGWLEVLELVALIVSQTGTLDAKNSGEVFVDDILLCREDFFFRKERDSSAVHVYDFNVFKTSFLKRVSVAF